MSGRVIKTITNIRFRRHSGTPQPNGGDNLIVPSISNYPRTERRPSEPYESDVSLGAEKLNYPTTNIELQCQSASPSNDIDSETTLPESPEIVRFMTTFNNIWTPFRFVDGRFEELTKESFKRLTIRDLVNGPYVIRFEPQPEGQHYSVGNDELYKYFTDRGKTVCWLHEIVEEFRQEAVSRGLSEESVYHLTLRNFFLQVDAFTILMENISLEQGGQP